MCKQGKRQIGSTFKPFLYATAIDQLKLSPCDSLPDAIFVLNQINLETLTHGVLLTQVINMEGLELLKMH